MPISTPPQITVPFATSGLKNSIPAASNPVSGNAGYDAGFPATNMTPKEAGGIPPFGQDFNGILFDITTAIRFLEAGMQFPYSSAFATAVGGYPLGAIVTRTDGAGFWRNTVANNMTDPEAFGAGWQPEGSGATSVTMTSSNVTLTALQASKQIITITGALTANLNLIMPTYLRQWLVVNNTTGAFSITCKTSAGGGVAIAQGTAQSVYGDGANIYLSGTAYNDYLNTTRIDIVSAATVNLTLSAPNTRHVNLTGAATVSAFTVASGQCYFVRFAGNITLVNSASLVTQTGRNIAANAGDTCIIRATSANNVEVICFAPGAGWDKSFTGDGFARLGNGAILQWGRSAATIAANGGTLDITFPITFPSDIGFSGVQPVSFGVNNQCTAPTAVALTTSTLRVTNFDVDSTITQIRWFAVGY